MIKEDACKGSADHVVNAHTQKLYINKEFRFGINSIFYKDINCLCFFTLACCIAGVFGNVIGKNWAKNCNRTLHSLLRLSGRRSKVRWRSMSVLEGFRLISRQINVTKSPLPSPLKYLQQWLKSQRTNHLNIWMLLHTEHFPPSVCSQWCLRYCWGHEVCSCRRSPVQPGLTLTVLINTHYTGLTFRSHKLLVEIKFSSTGNAACNHYSGLIILYGSPQKSARKICYKR